MADTSNIKMSPEEMESQASLFDSKESEFTTLVGQMGSMVDQLTSSWAGQSSQAFYDQFQDLIPSFQKTEQLIADIATQLRQVSATMTAMDQEIAGQIGVK